MTGFVYFIRPVGLPGPIKIGFSKVPARRLLDLTVWSPFPLEVVATVPGTTMLETNIHQCLARSHDRHEWFFPTNDVTGVVAKLVAGLPIERAIDLSARQGTIRKKSGPKPRPKPAGPSFREEIPSAQPPPALD